MNTLKLRKTWISLAAAAAFAVPGLAMAGVYVQCPGDTDGDAKWDTLGEVQPPNTRCMHISGGDGYSVMGDGKQLVSWSTGRDVGRIIPHVLAHPLSRNAGRTR